MISWGGRERGVWRFCTFGSDSNVAVCCVRGHGELCVTGVEVDRLRADDDDRASLFPKPLQGVEQHFAGEYVFWIRSARHFRSLPSTP
jgi:hypothetical protein